APHLLGNIRRAGHGAELLVKDLVTDVEHAIGLTQSTSPRATVGGNHFVEGKRGGVYQVHAPGVSVLLFPGYFIDRDVLNTSGGVNNPQFPAHMYATNSLVFLLALLWG